MDEDFDADFDMALPGDEGAPLPSCVGSDKQPRDVLEPHLSSGYDGVFAFDPCVLLRGHIGPACILQTTPAVGKEAWAMANVIADRIEADRAALAGIPDPAALVASHRQLVEALEGLLKECWGDQHSHMTREIFEQQYETEFAALTTARAVMGEA